MTRARKVGAFLALLGVCGLVAIAAEQPTKQAGSGAAEKEPSKTADTNSTPYKEESLPDSVRIVATTEGDVAVWSSVNGQRFYAEPNIRPVLLSPQGQPSRIAETQGNFDGIAPVHLRLKLFSSSELEQIAFRLSRDLNRPVKPSDVGLVDLKGLSIDVESPELKRRYGVKPFTVCNLAGGLSHVDIELQAERAREFVELINNGGVQFSIMFTFPKITRDTVEHRISAKRVSETRAAQELSQQGAELFAVKNAGEAMSRIAQELVAAHEGSLTAIPPNTISTDQLMNLFRVPDGWGADIKRLNDLDDRFLEQLTAVSKQQFESFHPFKFARDVSEHLNSTQDLEKSKNLVADHYTKHRSGWKAAASFGIGPFSIGGGGGQDDAVIDRVRKMDSDAFRSHLQSVHGLRYTDQGVQYRGLALCDTKQIRSLGELTVLTVTAQPTAAAGLRIRPLRPSAARAKEEAIALSKGQLRIVTKNVSFALDKGLPYEAAPQIYDVPGTFGTVAAVLAVPTHYGEVSMPILREFSARVHPTDPSKIQLVVRPRDAHARCEMTVLVAYYGD